jgi:hypothetical protein
VIQVQPTSVRAPSASSFSLTSEHPLAQNRALREQAATRGATGTEIAVLMALADFRNDHGAAWPSLATLVRQSQFSDKTVRRALARLRELGLLHVVLPATPRTSTRHRVELPGQGDQSERSQRPVKSQGSTQGNTKTRAREEPGRGAVPGRQLSPGAAPGSSPASVRAPSARAERSAANKAAWATRPRVLAPPARVQPHKPYQLPLPQGPLLRDMEPVALAEYLGALKRQAFGSRSV